MQVIFKKLTSGVEHVPYRPLRWISYAIDYQFSGLNPLGYHISNIFFHVLTTLFVFFTISALVENYRVALCAALIFAVHPVHTDCVTYLSGRRDILSTLFYILGFYFFLKSRKKKRVSLLLSAFGAYLLAIASKEMAVTLPVICFFYDLIQRIPDKGSLSKRISTAINETFSSHKLLYITFTLLALLFTYYKVVVKSPSNKEGFYGGSFSTQLLTVVEILVYYIKLLLLPINLIADYSYNSFPLAHSLYEPSVVFAFIVLGALAYLTLRLLSADKMVAFAIIWFFVTLLPVCHIFPHHELLAEHYLYLPSFGFVLAVALLFERMLTSAKRKQLYYVAFALVILLFSVRTVWRNYDWRDGFTLWTKTVKTVPNCVRALNNLGIEYFNKNRFKDAKILYQRAAQIQPVYGKAYYNLGNLYRAQKQYKEAMQMYKKAAQLNPKNFRVHNNLGNAYAMLKRYDQAIDEYKLALKLKPRYAEAHNNLGNVYRSKGNTDLAISHYLKAIVTNNVYVDAYYNLGIVYKDLRQYEKAIGIFTHLLTINSSHLPSRKVLGSLYAEMGQYDDALFHFKKAADLQPASPDTFKNLGRVYSKKGDYPQAVIMFERALSLGYKGSELYLALGSIYLEKLGEKQKALHYFKKWLERAPDHPDSERVSKIISTLEKEGTRQEG
jgi:tetratricopeptide (TPR) repeat protein